MCVARPVTRRVSFVRPVGGSIPVDDIINKRHKSAVSFISLAVIEQVDSKSYSISSQSRFGVTYSVEKKRKCNTLYLQT